MSKKIQIFSSFKEADKFDLEYYASMTPQQRLEIALKIMEPYYAAHKRSERILKFAKRRKS
jgi:hypothetical protein